MEAKIYNKLEAFHSEYIRNELPISDAMRLLYLQMVDNFPSFSTEDLDEYFLEWQKENIKTRRADDKISHQVLAYVINHVGSEFGLNKIFRAIALTSFPSSCYISPCSIDKVL